MFSMIAAAGNTRVMSNNENRKAVEEQYPHVEIAEISNPDAFKERFVRAYMRQKSLPMHRALIC